MDGDLHGALGSVIKFYPPTREVYLYAFRLTRTLAKCNPRGVFRISRDAPPGSFVIIESNIPVAFGRF
jgi:hypothetical protein